MVNPEQLIVLRPEPTAANPWRQVPHRVDQTVWIALFGRYRQPSTTSSPGQRPNDTRAQPQRRRRIP